MAWQPSLLANLSGHEASCTSDAWTFCDWSAGVHDRTGSPPGKLRIHCGARAPRSWPVVCQNTAGRTKRSVINILHWESQDVKIGSESLLLTVNGQANSFILLLNQVLADLHRPPRPNLPL